MVMFLAFHNGLLGRQRLLREHVERGAGDRAAVKRLDQSRLVDHAAARNIDQISGWLHRREHLLADDAARLRAQWRQRNQEIEFAGDLDEIVAATMRSKPSASRGELVMPITVMPKALQIRARYSAISPTPKMPTVLPDSSFAG